MERYKKGLSIVIFSLIVLLITLSGLYAFEDTSDNNEEVPVITTESDLMQLAYQTNIENEGWLDPVYENEVSGSLESENSVQAFLIEIPESQGSIKYRAYLEDLGWQEWVKNGEVAGSLDNTNSLRGIEIKLDGIAEENYDIYYQVYTDTTGWSDWSSNNEVAGTDNFTEDIKAINITFVNKGENLPEQVATIAANPQIDIDYAAHVKNTGWLDEVKDGQIAGTTGQSTPMEAVTINLDYLKTLNNSNDGVEYSLHVQNIGWTPKVANGEIAGTVGQSLQAEAITINLTGDIAQNYNVYYRVHSAFYGWLDWASNGQVAGTTGIGAAAEALQVVVLPKNAAAPGSTALTTINPEYLSSVANVDYTVEELSRWSNVYSNGAEAGTLGHNLPIEAFTITTPNKMPNSSITYQAHVSNVGWMSPVSDGTPAGIVEKGQKVEAIAISLTGEDAYSYDVWYQTYVQEYGWLGWAKNGEQAGTVGGGLGIEGFHVVLQVKGSPAPGATDNALLDLTPVNPNWVWPFDNYGPERVSSGFGPRNGTTHLGVDILAPNGTPIKACKSGTVKVAGWYYGYGICVVVTNDETGEDVYYAHMSALNTSVGSHVNQNDVIGFVGITGNANAYHLHLGVNDHGRWTNPLERF